METVALWAVLWDMSSSIAQHWAIAWLVFFLTYVVCRTFFRSRKIQDKPFDKKVFLHEVIFSALTLAGGMVIGLVADKLGDLGLIHVDQGPPNYLTIAFQFVIYFFAFDLYFYVLHRL